jgi:hypothetical protein
VGLWGKAGEAFGWPGDLLIAVWVARAADLQKIQREWGDGFAKLGVGGTAGLRGGLTVGFAPSAASVLVVLVGRRLGIGRPRFAFWFCALSARLGLVDDIARRRTLQRRRWRVLNRKDVCGVRICC